MRRIHEAFLAGATVGLLAVIPGDTAHVPVATHQAAAEQQAGNKYDDEIAVIAAGILRLRQQAPAEEQGRGDDRAMLAVTVPLLGKEVLELAAVPAAINQHGNSPIGPSIEIKDLICGQKRFDVILARTPAGITEL